MRKRWCTDLETDNQKDTAEVQATETEAAETKTVAETATSETKTVETKVAETIETGTAATGTTEAALEMTESEAAKAPAEKPEASEPNSAQIEALSADKTDTSEADQKGKKNSPNTIMIVIIIILFLAGAAALFLMRGAIGDEVHFQGAGWYENADVKDAASLTDTLSGLEAFASSGSGGSSMAESWVYGNDMQIYSHGALIAMDEEYYYAANGLDGYRLYRISRDGSYSGERISDIPASSVSVREGKLYFVSNFVNASNTPGIYSINTDGTGLEYISDADPEYLMLVNDWLYYLSAIDGHIYKMNIADRREIQLTDRSCVSMTMHENTIYFSFQKEQEDEDGDEDEYVLAAMDVDGNSYRELASGGHYNHVMYADGEIYYHDGENDFFRLNLDETQFSGIYYFVRTEAQQPGIQIYDGNYCYVDSSRGNAIVITEGPNTWRYNVENVKNFFIFDQKLYVNYLEGGTEEKISVYDLADGKRILSLIPFFG